MTPPPLSESSPPTERVRRGPDGVEHTFTISYIPDPDYAVLDVVSATAHRLPDHDIFNAGCLGVIAAPGAKASGFMVVEFQFIVGGTGASLHCFSSQTGAWVEKDVRNPLPRWIWNFNNVVSHNGKLWWVDTAAGLLACDPFADNPDMAYVPLPENDDDNRDDGARGCACYYCSERQIATRRRVQLSNATFRCVQITSARKTKDHAHDTAPATVTMRTLADPETAHWTLDYKVPFADIWADHTYKAAGLPEKEPVLAFIHPNNPDVLYFSLDDYLFAVDMRAKKLIECEAHESGVSSSSLLAWELPPALTAPAAGVPENGSNDESATAASA
ncbi:uncharacterized protein LOC101762993 [Setaria italica]|nr:uncharacterized protein LOC101762993 [Setaria italica]TKV95101.1 hypothetical protein SEVIR_9G338500v2 [Setaria viridis]